MGMRAPAGYVPADDGAVAVGVRRFDDRVARARRARALERVVAFAQAPAPVDALLAARCVVDLLVLVLADVADPYRAGCAVEREAPRVAQSPHPRFGHHALAADERVVRGHAVRRVAVGVRIDAQDLRERAREV